MNEDNPGVQSSRFNTNSGIYGLSLEQTEYSSTQRREAPKTKVATILDPDPTQKQKFLLDKTKKNVVPINPKRINIKQEKDFSLSITRNPSKTSGEAQTSTGHLDLLSNQPSDESPNLGALCVTEDDYLLTRTSFQLSPILGDQLYPKTSSKTFNFNDLGEYTHSEISRLDQSFGIQSPFRGTTANHAPQILVVENSDQKFTESNKEGNTARRRIQEGKDNRFYLDEEYKQIPDKDQIFKEERKNSDREFHSKRSTRQVFPLQYPNDLDEVIIPNNGATEVNEHNNNQVNEIEVPSLNSRLRNTTNTVAAMVNSQQINEQEAQRNSIALSEAESKTYIIRTIGFFIALTFLSLTFLLTIKNLISFQIIFATGYCYFIFLFLENVITPYHAQQLEAWKKQEQIFTAIDAICGIIGLIFVQIKLSNIFPICVHGGLPFLLSSIAYMLKSNAPTKIKKPKVFWKYMLFFQIIFITLKLDKTIDWNWSIIFSPFWVFFLITGVYLVAQSFLLIIMIFLALFGQLQEDINPRTQFLGFIWLFIYYGLSVVGFFSLLGITEAYGSSQTYQLLNIILLVSISLNCFLTFYTVFFFKPLTTFTRYYSLRGDLFENLEESITRQEDNRRVDFQVEKKENYFVRLSSTYFLPLNHQLLAKNKENLLRIHQMLSLFNNRKPLDQIITDKNIQKEKNPISIQALQQYKQDLNVPKDKFSLNKEISNSKFPMIFSARLRDVFQKPKEGQTETEGVGTLAVPKVNLSADDIENFKKFESSQRKNKGPGAQEEDLCYICFERTPNAVVMNCGHGGICYECAITSAKAKNECMECRSPVEAIHKVDLNLNLINVIKSCEISKIITIENGFQDNNRFQET